MDAEQKRLLSIAQKITDDTVVKGSDRLLVIVANKAGKWTISSNLNSDKDILPFLTSIVKNMKTLN